MQPSSRTWINFIQPTQYRFGTIWTYEWPGLLRPIWIELVCLRCRDRNDAEALDSDSGHKAKLLSS